MTTTRRDFPTAAGTAHDHSHQAVPSDVALRVKSLESLLVEKGLVDPAALDAIVDLMEHKVGPRNGARVVARGLGRPRIQRALAKERHRVRCRAWLFGLANGGPTGARKYSQGAQFDRLHPLFLLPVGRTWTSACLVQIRTLPLAGSD